MTISIAPAIADCIELGPTEGRDIALAPGLVYAMSLSGYLFTLDRTDPTALTIRDTLNAVLIQGAHGLAVDGDTAYISCYDPARLTAVDVTDPDALAVLGSVTDATALALAADVELTSTHAIVASVGNGIAVVSRANPASMAVVGTLVHAHVSAPTAVHVVSDTRAYVGSQGGGGNDGLAHIDLTDPTAPALVGFGFKTAVFAIDVVGDYAYTITSGPANRLDTWELADPVTHAVHDDPVWLATVSNDDMDRPLGIKVTNGLAVIACQGDRGMMAFCDVTDPASPAYITSLFQPTPGGGDAGQGSGELYHCYPVAISGDYVYTTAHGEPGHATAVKLNREAGVPVDATISGLFMVDGQPARVIG